MRPLCGLSEACLLSSYGLRRRRLGILDRLQKLFGLLRPVCGLSEASRQPAGLLRPLCGLSEACPPLFLWASEGNVRHFGPASKASRQPAGLLRPLCGLSEACLLSSYGLPKATLGILDRLQKPLGSRQASCGLSVACPKPASSLLMGFQRQPQAFWTGFKSLSAASRPLAASLWPVRSLPPLFLWASEGNVRHFGSASNAPQPVRSLPPLFLWASEGNVRHFGPASKASRQPAGLLRPLCGLSEACLLSSYGLPKATLGILARLQTLPRASPQPCPLLGSWQACLFSSYGLPKATLGILARLQTLPRASPQPCPLLGRLPKATFRPFGPPSKAFWASCGLSVACPKLLGSRQPLAASLWPVRSLPPLFLWASEGNVRHFGPASKASRQPAGLLRPLCGLSEACLLSSYGLPKATLGILDRLQRPLGSRQASCGLSVACPKPASSLLMGFRRQR